MSPSRPTAGDMTGKIKAEKQHEALQEQRDRSAEMSLASDLEAQEQVEGVFDPHTGGRLDAPAVVPSERGEPLAGGFAGTAYAPEKPPAEPVFTGYETEEQMTPHLANRGEQPVVRSVLRTPTVKIRVAQDLDDMTYGMNSQGYPNNMSFKEGFTYEVSNDVADHLNQRGLVAQWVP